MSLTIQLVGASWPEALTESATDVGRSATGLRERIHQQRVTLASLVAGWQGSASDAAIARAVPTLVKIQRIHDAMSRLQATLQAGGTAFVISRTDVVATVERLRLQGWQVSPDGSVSVRWGSALDFFARLGPLNAMWVQRLAANNAFAVKDALAQFDSIDRWLDREIRATVADFNDPSTAVPSLTVPTGKDPVEVRDWWNSLSPADRDWVVAERPEMIGNLNGVPVKFRSRANELTMTNDVERVRNRAAVTGVTVEQVMADPDRFGLTPTDVVRYRNAVAVGEGLRRNRDKTDVDGFLYVYEPEAFDGQGRAAIAIGNPDEADNTAVVVPGTSHSVTEGWLSSDDALNVYDETSAADRGRSTAVVAWMGYDAPNSLFDPQVAQVGNARDGGRLLANDVNALETTNLGDPHVTVIGHSYGSTTVADACAGYGLRADDVVLIGSPGTDLARNADDFNLAEGGHVFVGAASTDPITLLGGIAQAHVPWTGVTVGLGEDPAADIFGSTRFKAEIDGVTPPWLDHSGYLVRGSESMFSIGDVASGHGDALERDGMTADHRFTIPGVDYEVDPELFRIPTGEHYHR